MKKKYFRKSVDITLIVIEVLLSPILMLDDFEPTLSTFAIVIVWFTALFGIAKVLADHSRILNEMASDDED